MTRLLMRYPGGRARVLSLSYDDGVIFDRRLIEIMQKNGIKGTFNLNSGSMPKEPSETNRRLCPADAVKLYLGSGMEVAVHGLHHPYWNQIPPALANYDILSDRLNLEEMFGTVIRGAAYPFGATSDDAVAMLRAAGITYCRTTVSNENFSQPTDWLRMPTTCHHGNARLMELADQFLNRKIIRAPLFFLVWGHSYEFNDNNNWEVIERFCEYMGGRDEVWYATNGEIYDYTEAFSRLQFSANGNLVYNPTFTEVWFEMNGRPYSVKPGETRKLG